MNNGERCYDRVVINNSKRNDKENRVRNDKKEEKKEERRNLDKVEDDML